MLAQSFPEWTLLGEYCGVWDTQDVSSEAGEDDALDIEDPVGLGPLLYDKVSDLGYTSKSAPAAAATGRPLVDTTMTENPVAPLLAQACWKRPCAPDVMAFCHLQIQSWLYVLPEEDCDIHFPPTTRSPCGLMELFGCTPLPMLAAHWYVLYGGACILQLLEGCSGVA